jgi:hypothetical protein
MHPTTDGPALLRVATYARVGSGRTEDQDLAIQLQAARIREYAEQHNVQIVAEYTDLGVARSTPWRARPAARALTSAALTPATDLDAVAIGDDPAHVFGPDGIASALTALPIPVYCLTADCITAVTADSVVARIVAGISDRTVARPRRRARPFRARSL